MLTEDSVAGKRVAITGGASGIAGALVTNLVRHGARVVAMDVADGLGAALVDQANRDGPGTAIYVHCDVSDAGSVREAFSKCADFFDGELDALLNAAGIAPWGPAHEITVEAWDLVLGVNARGTFLTNQAAFFLMKDKGGRIINVASAGGVLGYVGKGHYSAAKGAVLSWTRTIAHEWAQHRITANSMLPAIQTPMSDRSFAALTPEQNAELNDHVKRMIPLGGKLGDAERDFAPVARFLISDASRFITGQAIAVDGGWVMVR